MTLSTIKDLNLGEEKIQEIANQLNWSVEDVLECDDFHAEKNAVSMMKWVHEDMSGEDIIDELCELEIVNPQLSLFENFLLHHENVFSVDDWYLFFYV